MPYLFVIFILVGWSLLFGIHLLVYSTLSRVYDFTLPHWPIVLAGLSFTYFLASYGVRSITNVIADWFYYVAAAWLGFIFLLFSVLIVYGAIHLLTGYDSSYVLTTLLALTLSLSVYALVQGGVLVTKSYTVPVPGLVDPLKVVHLSDIHVGTVHQTHYLERVVAMTNSLSPDIVLVTGDLFDGSAPIQEEVLKPLNALEAKSFFSNGNHEEYEGLERVRSTLTNLDMQLLENEAVEYRGVQIIGINDRQSFPHKQMLGSVLEKLPNPGIPRLLMYHTPVEWDDARSHNIDLMLSGHTHNGQLYPFTLLVRAFFKHINGLYEKEGMYLHVSPGTGTWGPPMRLGSHNQVTLLELVPKK